MDKSLFIILILLLFLTGCKSFITGTNPPIPSTSSVTTPSNDNQNNNVYYYTFTLQRSEDADKLRGQLDTLLSSKEIVAIESKIYKKLKEVGFNNHIVKYFIDSADSK